MSIIHMTNSASAVLKSMLRECPSCHEKQSFALAKAKETVICKKCGSTIAPNVKAGGQ
jgi:ribosomal protein S27E